MIHWIMLCPFRFCLLILAFKLGEKVLEIIQERTIRFGFDVHNFTPISALGVRLGGVEQDVMDSMVCYWNRLVHIPASRLTHNMFECNCRLLHQNAKWTSKIKALTNVTLSEGKFISNLSAR